MQIPDKNTGDSYTAEEFTSFKDESQNAIESTGQTLSASSDVQLAKALTIAGQTANSYQDSGVADAYVLTKTGSLEQPISYVDGMRIMFTAANVNTGASTVNVSGLGVKKILTINGDELPVAQITSRFNALIYDSSADTGSGAFFLNTTNIYDLSFFGNDLAAAVTAIGLDVVTLTISEKPNDLTGNLTKPENITLNWKSGAPLGGAFTLTHNGGLIAGDYRIFEDELVVSGLSVANPYWHGMVADGTTGDSLSVQKSIDSLVDRGVLLVPAGKEVNFGSGIVVSGKPITIKTDGPLSCTFKASFVGNLLSVSNTSRTLGGSSTPQEWEIEQQNGFNLINVTLEGNYRGQITDAIVFTGLNDDTYIKDVGIYNFKGAGIRWGDRTDTTSVLNMRESALIDVEIKNCGYDTGATGTSKASMDMYKASGNGGDNFNNLTFVRCKVIYPRYIAARFRNEYTTNEFRKFSFERCFFHGNKSLSGNDSNGDPWSNTNNLVNFSSASGAKIREVWFSDSKLIEHQDGSAGILAGNESSFSWRGGVAQGYASDATSRVAFKFENAHQSYIGDINANTTNSIKGLIDVVSMQTNNVVTIGPLSWIDDATGNAVVTTTTDQSLIEDLNSYQVSYAKQTDAGVGTLLNSSSLVYIPERSYIKRAWFVPDGALTTNATNYADLKYTIYNAAGSSVGVSSTTTDGPTGNWTANVPVELSGITTKLLGVGYSIAVSIDKIAGGVIVPRGVFVIELSKSVRYIQ